MGHHETPALWERPAVERPDTATVDEPAPSLLQRVKEPGYSKARPHCPRDISTLDEHGLSRLLVGGDDRQRRRAGLLKRRAPSEHIEGGKERVGRCEITRDDIPVPWQGCDDSGR